MAHVSHELASIIEKADSMQQRLLRIEKVRHVTSQPL